MFTRRRAAAFSRQDWNGRLGHDQLLTRSGGVVKARLDQDGCAPGAERDAGGKQAALDPAKHLVAGHRSEVRPAK
jgi:hypothetical protein